MHGSHPSLSPCNHINNQPATNLLTLSRNSINTNDIPLSTHYETGDGDVFIIGGSFYQRHVEMNQNEGYNAMANGYNTSSFCGTAPQHVGEGDELTTDDATLSEQRVEELESRVKHLSQEVDHIRNINGVTNTEDPVGFFDEQEVDEIRTITRLRPKVCDKSTECTLEQENLFFEKKTAHNFHRIDLDAVIEESLFPPHYWSKLEQHFTKKPQTRNIGFQSHQFGMRSVEVMKRPKTRSFAMVVRTPKRETSVQSDAPDSLETIRAWTDLNYRSVYSETQLDVIAQLLHSSSNSREEFVHKVSPYLRTNQSTVPVHSHDSTARKMVDKQIFTDFDTFYRSQTTNTTLVVPNSSSTGVQANDSTQMIDRSTSPVLSHTQRVACGVQTSITRHEDNVPMSPANDQPQSTIPPPPTSSKSDELLIKDLRDMVEKATINESTNNTVYVVPSRKLTPDELKQVFSTPESPVIDIRVSPYPQTQAFDQGRTPTAPPADFSVTTDHRVVHEQSNQFLLPDDVEIKQLRGGKFPVEEQILARSQRLGSTDVTRQFGPNVGVKRFSTDQPTSTSTAPEPTGTASDTWYRSKPLSKSGPFSSSTQPTHFGRGHTDSSRFTFDPSSHAVQYTRDGHNIPMEVTIACEQLASYYKLGHQTVRDEVMSEQLNKVRSIWFSLTSSSSENNLATIAGFVNTLKNYHENLLRDVIQSTNAQGSSTLHLAIGHGAWSVVSLILDSGHAEPDQFNSEGYTPIMIAAVSNLSSPNVISPLQRLFKMGNVNLQAKTTRKPTPLILAAQNGLADTVQLLLQNNADPNLQDAAGNTALMFAVEMGHQDVINTLLNCPNLDLSLRDNQGKDVFAIAVRRNDSSIIERIVSVLNNQNRI